MTDRPSLHESYASRAERTVIGSAMSDPRHPVGTIVACVDPDTLRPDPSMIFVLTAHGWVGGSSAERRSIDQADEEYVRKVATLAGDRAFLYPR